MKITRMQIIKYLEKMARNIESYGYGDIDFTINSDNVKDIEIDVTLADFLGWEEGVEYEGEYKGRYKIENGVLWNFSTSYEKWCIFSFDWADEVIRNLQQAKKVEQSKKDRLLDELQSLVSSERINEIIEELRAVENE